MEKIALSKIFPKEEIFFFSPKRINQSISVFLPSSGMSDSPKQATSGFFMSIEDFLNHISQREIGVRDNTGDSGMVFLTFLTFFRDFSYKFCFTNGFQVFRPLSPVTGTALYKYCFFDILFVFYILTYTISTLKSSTFSVNLRNCRTSNNASQPRDFVS